MSGYLQKIKVRIRIFRKRITFHHPFSSAVFARLRYLFPNNDIENAFRRVAKEIKGEAFELDWKRDKDWILDWLFCREFYAITPVEYFRFGLDKSKGEEKKDHVGWLELYFYYLLLNETGSPDTFELKDRTYRAFRPFYKREQESISSPQDRDRFLAFLQRHKAGIIKPVSDYGGHGVEILRCSEEQTSEQIWNNVCGRCPFVLEELIIQAPEMNAFYPNSVNTIRYNTFFHEGKLTRMQAVLRVGRGGSVVDNATSGGIHAVVDTETGRILSPAISDRNELFEIHPDTGIQFEGNHIPRWEELNALVDQVVRVVPQQKQVGWDFALSTDGWVIVEGNTTPSLQGFNAAQGLRPLIKETFGCVIPLWD